MWDPQTTFLLVHGEPECNFWGANFCIFTSRCCQAYHHDRLAEMSSNLPLNSSLLNAEARNSSLKFEPAFVASTECTPRTRRARVWGSRRRG
eukprot:6886707-Prymnesium_polylepis.1